MSAYDFLERSLKRCSRADYFAIANSLKAEFGGDCLSLGATISAPHGSHFCGACMMTTWEFGDVPVLRVEQINAGDSLTYDERDTYTWFANEDFLWRAELMRCRELARDVLTKAKEG